MISEEIGLNEFGFDSAFVTFDGIQGKRYELQYIFPNGNVAPLSFNYVATTTGEQVIDGELFTFFNPDTGQFEPPKRGLFRLAVPAQ